MIPSSWERFVSVEVSKYVISVSGSRNLQVGAKSDEERICAWLWRRFRREMLIFCVQTAPMREESSDRKFSEGAFGNLWHCAGQFAHPCTHKLMLLATV